MATCVVVDYSINFTNGTLSVHPSGEEIPFVHVREDRMATTTKIFDARGWLADESRPGVFGLVHTSVGCFFGISDPDVAFEFRLRFA